MRIVRFSTPKNHNPPFSDQKISLAKLSQVKAQSNISHGQSSLQQPPVFPNTTIKKQQLQSHIKWVQDPVVTGAILNEVKNMVSPELKQLVSPKNIPRRKIFQQKSTVLKENFQIPTFTKMPSIKNIPEQDQTHYYSMIVNQPKQEAFHMINSKISQSKQYHSPFTTNEDNTRIQQQNAAMFNQNTNSIQKSSITELTEYHIPRLQQKLKEHDKELTTIKKYLKNTEQINTLREEIKDYQQVQSFVENQNQIQRNSEILMLSIEEARKRERQEMRIKEDNEMDLRIEQIEQERLRRLEKIQKENQKLYQNLKYHSHDEDPEFQSNPHQDYRFQGPVAFPSKDWQSQRQIIAPSSNDFYRHSNTTDNFRKHRQYNSGDMEISPILKKQVHQISSIGFSNNKTQLYSLEANTFREIMSPLEFQGEKETW